MNSENREYYFIFCQGILGVKTNIRDFQWVYGSHALTSNYIEYEKCVIKFNVWLKKENELKENKACNKRFQSYSWNDKECELYYRRSFFSCLKLGYNIRFTGNTVEACIGKGYYNLVKNRMMNLHGIYYLLADIANMMLLKNGYMSLYASAVHSLKQNRGVVCFAPPNTGKTITATKLCGLNEYLLVGEDIVVTDGKRVFSCPWTRSYRKEKTFFDSAGSFGRVTQSNENKICHVCDVTDLVVLSLGEKMVYDDKDEVLRQALILNGYLFNYYSSPIIKILGYFNLDYCVKWNDWADELLHSITDNSKCYVIQSENSLDFYKRIHCEILGGSI